MRRGEFTEDNEGTQEIRLRVTYDSSVNAAYIYFVDSIGPGESKRQRACECPDDGTIIFDFDEFGRVLGLEVLNADRSLRPETLAEAERL